MAKKAAPPIVDSTPKAAASSALSTRLATSRSVDCITAMATNDSATASVPRDEIARRAAVGVSTGRTTARPIAQTAKPV